MALAAGTVWECRTAGNANGAGGFVAGTGTDRSQQDAVQTSFTDLVIGVTTTELTSAAFPFGATDVGNIIKITAGTGFTVGYYQVVSVSVVTATMDRSVGTGGSTGGTGFLGGASGVIDAIVDVVVAGNTVWVKAGTYSETVSIPGTDGGNGTPIILEGYNATRGDNPLGANRPLIEGADVRANNITVIDANGWVIKHFVVQNATGAGILQSAGAAGDLMFINVRSTSNTTFGFDLSRDTILLGCEADSNSSDGFKMVNERNYKIISCYSHDNTGEGIQNSSGSFDAYNSVSESNADSGFETGGAGSSMFAYNCVAYNNTGAANSGFLAGTATNLSAVENIFINNSSSSNGQYAFNLSGGTDVTNYFDFNNYFGHTTELNNITAGDNDTGDADPLFTNPATGNFTLQATSPCLNTGLDASTYIANVTV